MFSKTSEGVWGSLLGMRDYGVEEKNKGEHFPKTLIQSTKFTVCWSLNFSSYKWLTLMILQTTALSFVPLLVLSQASPLPHPIELLYHESRLSVEQGVSWADPQIIYMPPTQSGSGSLHTATCSVRHFLCVSVSIQTVHQETYTLSTCSFQSNRPLPPEGDINWGIKSIHPTR